MAVRKTAAGLRLKRWFKEDWRTPKGNKGYDKGENTFRPTKRISKDTPATWSELSKGEKRRAKIEKDTKGRVSRYKKKKTMSKGGMSTPAWTRKEGKSKSGGLNRKGIASYRRANPGSKLSMAVTTKPSKLKKGSKAAKRRKSFCARMSGVKGPMKDEKGRPTRKALALRKWNCKHGCTMNVNRKSKKKRKYQDGGVNNKEDFSMFSANDPNAKPLYKPSKPINEQGDTIKEIKTDVQKAAPKFAAKKLALKGAEKGAKSLAGKALVKGAGKVALKTAARFIPGVGQLMMARDIYRGGKYLYNKLRAEDGGMVYAPKGFHWMKKGDGKYKLMKHAPKKFKKHTGASLKAKFPIQKRHK